MQNKSTQSNRITWYSMTSGLVLIARVIFIMASFSFPSSSKDNAC